MPQSLEVSKEHKVMIINCLKLVILCVFVFLWLNYFSEWTHFFNRSRDTYYLFCGLMDTATSEHNIWFILRFNQQT